MEERYATSSIYKYMNDRWRAQFPYFEDGVWRKKTQLLEHRGRDKGRSHKHRDAAMVEAEAIRARLNAEAEAEALEPAVSMSVAELVSSYITMVCADIARSTATGYSGMLRRNIEPYIGSIPLEDLTEEDVQEWVGVMAKKHARSTACNSLRLLRGSLKYGLRKKLVSENVAAWAKVPKNEDADYGQPNSLTGRERVRVLNTLNASIDVPAILAAKIALYTGLRRGELCALKWKCVDFSHFSIRVEAAIGHTDAEFYIKGPKSVSSRRTIPNRPEDLMHDLAARKRNMEEECTRLGTEFSGEMFVLGLPDGSFLKPPRVNDAWRALSKALNLHGVLNRNTVTFHDLRHSFATYAVANGVDPRTLASLMGHSKASMTLDKYASADPKATASAMDALGRLYKSASQYPKAG